MLRDLRRSLRLLTDVSWRLSCSFICPACRCHAENIIDATINHWSNAGCVDDGSARVASSQSFAPRWQWLSLSSFQARLCGHLKQLTSGKLDTYPVCSPDSRWVYFIDREGGDKLSRVPIDGGPSQVVAAPPVSSSAISFDISSDGKQIFFPTLEHAGEHKERLAVVQTDSGKLVMKDFDHFRFGLLRLSRDDKAVVYPARDNGVDNLWLQPLDGSKGKYLTSFKTEHIYDFHWSFDGKQLALVRGHTESDVVLLRSAQQ